MGGADAAVSSTINYSPTLRDALRLYETGDKPAAFAKQAENAKLCSMFGQYESQAKNVQKNIMKMSGVDVGPSRLPKRDLTSEEFSALQKELIAGHYIDLPSDAVLHVEV